MKISLLVFYKTLSTFGEPLIKIGKKQWESLESIGINTRTNAQKGWSMEQE